MALDFHQVSPQVQDMTDRLQRTEEAYAKRLAKALDELSATDISKLQSKLEGSHITWLVPGLHEPLDYRGACPPIPTNFAALAVDGSHIDVSRHNPIRYFLINLGLVTLQYGAQPRASLSSQPQLYTKPDELFLRDPESFLRDTPVEGPLLGVKRNIIELMALADLVETLPHDLPAIALVDGSLVLWGLVGQTYQEFVKRQLLEREFVPTLDRLRHLATQRPLAMAAYISLPRSTEVVNALRMQTCPYIPPNCDTYCRMLHAGERPCDVVDGLLDRDLFIQLLQEGERSAIFSSQSSVVNQWYGEHGVHFFYLHAGGEIARVEVPTWIATSRERLALTHALVYDQCRRGLGYPAAIAEAHEQAVITGSDREAFAMLLENMFSQRHLPHVSSAKEYAKRVKWL